MELGTWYGKSSRFILRHLAAVAEEDGTTCSLFCVDKYKNNAIYSKLLMEPSPEDKMFFNFLRFESFVSSVESLSLQTPAVAERCSVCTMVMDVHEAGSVLQELGIEVDMVFIDAEKKTLPLSDLVVRLRHLFPRAVIVGDDLVFPSVQFAMKRLERQGITPIQKQEAYLVTPVNNCPAGFQEATKKSSKKNNNKKKKKSGMEDSHDWGSLQTAMQVAEREVAVDCGVHAVGVHVAQLVQQGCVQELRALLFDPACPLFKVYASGHCSIAHTFLSHYMQVRRAPPPPPTPPQTSSSSSWSEATSQDMLAIALQVVESAGPDHITLSEGMLTIFDLVNHDVIFQ